MEQNIALKQSFELKIDIEQVAREWWEIVILRDLYASPLGKDLIFRGGTALRLAYNSPRFSQDLDFSFLGPVPYEIFERTIKNIESRYEELTLKDIASKHNTYLAEFKIKEPWRQRPFSLKIEISKRGDALKKGQGYKNALLRSPASNLEVLANVATMERITEEKKEALRARKLARDVFDLWYLGQKLKIDLNYDKGAIPRERLKQELRKFLPRDYYTVIDGL